MFSKNPFQKALAVLGYAGIVVGFLLLLFGLKAVLAAIIGGVLLLFGLLSIVGFLVVSALNWTDKDPA